VSELRGLPESPQLARALARRSQLAMLSDSPGAESLSREALVVASRVGDRFATINAARGRDGSGRPVVRGVCPGYIADGTARFERSRGGRLLALHEGGHGDAIGLRSDAAGMDRGIGYAFDAAAIELELASALDGAGEHQRASALREASETFFASTGCVHAI
jgi:hypothetical protein